MPLERQHLDAIVGWFNDPEVTRWTKRVGALSRLQEDKFYEQMAVSREDVVWAVLDEGERHIGVSGIHGIDWVNRNGKTGTVISDKSAWC